MRFILRSFAIFAVAARRLIAQRGLAIATAVGLVASVAIVMSIPLYSDAVYYQVLQNELSRPADEGEIQRPPFAFMFRYVGSLYGLLEWDDIEQVDEYLWNEGPDLLGLPSELKVRYFRTDNFRLFPASEAAYASVRDPMAWINYATADNFADHITIIEGAWPAVADANPEVPMEILVNVAMADEFGMQVGEEFMTFRRSEREGSTRNVQVPVRISGIWEASDVNDPYWFYRQTVFAGQFFIPEDSFRLRLVPQLDDEIAQALWYFVQDGSKVTADDVGWLLGRISFLQQQAASILPNTRLEVSPYDALVKYRRSSGVLNVLLYAFSIPIIGLMLAFIGLVVGLSVSRQRNEIAVLRSRGATVMQVLGIAALEAMLLGMVALAAGVPASQRDRPDHRCDPQFPQLHDPRRRATHRHDDEYSAFWTYCRGDHHGGPSLALVRRLASHHRHLQARTRAHHEGAVVAARLARRTPTDPRGLRHLPLEPTGQRSPCLGPRRAARSPIHCSFSSRRWAHWR